MDDLELEEGVVVRPVWGRVNGKLCFLWRLSWMPLAWKRCSVGWHSFGMVIWEDLFMDLFFLDGTCLGKVTGSKKEEKVVVEEVVLWVV